MTQQGFSRHHGLYAQCRGIIDSPRKGEGGPTSLGFYHTASITRVLLVSPALAVGGYVTDKLSSLPLVAFLFVVFTGLRWICERYLLKIYEQEEKPQMGKEILYMTVYMSGKRGDHEQKLS